MLFGDPMPVDGTCDMAGGGKLLENDGGPDDPALPPALQGVGCCNEGGGF